MSVPEQATLARFQQRRRQRIRQVLLPGDNVLIGPERVSFVSAGAFAYQAFAGVALPVSAVPGLESTLEYRFFGTARMDTFANRVSPQSRQHERRYG